MSTERGMTEHNDRACALIQAVKNKKKDEVDAEIEAGADVNITDKKGKTALLYAVQQSNYESVVRALIDAGADVNITDNEGKTAVIYAVLHENEAVARALIVAGADVNVFDRQGNAALIYAVLRNNLPLVQLLIDAEAGVNVLDRKENTVLINAVMNKNESLVKTLIDAGADVNAFGRQEYTALFHAALCNMSRLAQTLIDAGADVNIIDYEGKTALFYAVQQSNNESVVRVLVDAGADVNIIDCDRHGALAVLQSEEESVDRASFVGTAETIDRKEKTPLIFAVLNQKKSFVKGLIRAGADVNVCDGEKKTALIYAVLKENESLVQTLIDAGADVNAFDDKQNTVLIHAVLMNNEALVRMLIDAGADVKITNNEGKTALAHAAYCENENIAKTLINVGTNVNAFDKNGETALMIAVENEKETLTEALLNAGADVNMTDNLGKTALFYATSNEYIVHVLIEAGSDINITDRDLKTPIFYSLSNQFIVKEMFENGRANVNSRDVYGRTPLFYALIESLGSLQYLLDIGANLYVKDNCNVDILSFFIDYFLLNKFDEFYLYDGFELLITQGMAKTRIFKALAKGVFCKILSSYSVLKPSCGAIIVARNYCESNEENLKLRTLVDLMQKLRKSTTVRDVPQLSQILDILYKLNNEPNCADSDGNTAVHYASCLPFMRMRLPQKIIHILHICSKLEQFGMSFNVRNHRHETPILFCLSRAIYEVKTHKKNCTWPSGEPVLQVCKFLLENGCSVNEATQTGDTVFHLVLKLVQQGVYIFNTAKGKAILNEGVKLLELIVHWKATNAFTAQKRNAGLDSPLHLWAALKLNLAQKYKSGDEVTYFEEYLKTMFGLLLEGGAQVNDRNSHQEAPLHLCRTWAAVKLLLDAGANPNDVDYLGKTPLFVAAENIIRHQDSDCIYPDAYLGPKEFWIAALEKGFNPWTADKRGQSVMSVLLRAETYMLAKDLLEVACEKEYIKSTYIAASLLNAICEDDSPRSQWKSILVQMILKSSNTSVLGKENEDTSLHKCCRNIVAHNSSQETKQTVHWEIAKQLLLFGASSTIRDAEGLTCLEIANTCPELRELLIKPVDVDEFPLLIPWKSVSRTYEQKLAKVARRQECNSVEHFWFHRKHLASGSFGFVFAGINERDGREVAIKRIETLRMERPEDKREIKNLLALADCEQVVRYLSFCEDERFTYVVLELMEGNLEEYLDNAFDAGKCTVLCNDVLAGLRYLHDLNVLHRDIKPTNMLYKAHPKLCLKIADFGLSRRIDNTGSTSVFSTNAGTRSWMAPEVLMSSKEHSKSSDVFSCGLVLHYIFTGKKHPFAPPGCAENSYMQITKIQTNIMESKLEGWDDSISLEAQHLVKMMIEFDENGRPSAAEALNHPFFWSKEKKLDFLSAVGNQPEFECPRAKVTCTTVVEDDLEVVFGTIVKHGRWNDPSYVHMPAIYAEMMTKRKMAYDSFSTVELVRFIRNAIAHVSGTSRSTLRKQQLLEDFVFLEYFPNLVIEVYRAVTTHGWDQAREEIKFALKK